VLPCDGILARFAAQQNDWHDALFGKSRDKCFTQRHLHSAIAHGIRTFSCSKPSYDIGSMERLQTSGVPPKKERT
jgi:hypothetical protein